MLQIMRKIIGEFPASSQVNSAYYYIGLGHFKLGHYSRAIDALEKVGTALSTQDLRIEKVEAGRRLYIKIDDKDLAILEPGQPVKITCKSKSGDTEVIDCLPVGRNVRMALGSISTRLGTAEPGNAQLEVMGGDQIDVLYIDQHTADKKFDQKRLKQVLVVGNATVQIMDGSFNETLGGVVLGKSANLQVADADYDRSGEPDTLQATAEIWRRKSLEEIEDEKAERAAAAASETEPTGGEPEKEIDPYRRMDSIRLTFTENAPHSGLFRAGAPLQNAAEPNPGDDKLQARPGDLLRLVYIDEVNITEKPRTLTTEAKCIEGNLGDVRVTKSSISDEELRLRTKLKTASALTHIGNHYGEFGLEDKAKLKYNEALQVCEEIFEDARNLGGSLLEQTYVQLWRIYFAMDELNLALAMSQRLQREFPNSTFVDEAILQQAHVARKRGDLPRAISLYSSLVKLQQSALKGEGQFGIGECYEEMASRAQEEPGRAALRARLRSLQTRLRTVSRQRQGRRCRRQDGELLLPAQRLRARDRCVRERARRAPRRQLPRRDPVQLRPLPLPPRPQRRGAAEVRHAHQRFPREPARDRSEEDLRCVEKGGCLIVSHDDTKTLRVLFLGGSFVTW